MLVRSHQPLIPRSPPQPGPLPSEAGKIPKFEELLPESQCRNLVCTVLYAPYSLDSGRCKTATTRKMSDRELDHQLPVTFTSPHTPLKSQGFLEIEDINPETGSVLPKTEIIPTDIGWLSFKNIRNSDDQRDGMLRAVHHQLPISSA